MNIPLTIRNQRGIALVTGLLAMVLIGLLVTGVLYFSTQEYRVGRNMIGQEQALAVAEYGSNELLRNWDATLNASMNDGDVVTRVYSPPGGGVDTVTVTRLNTNLFWLVSVSTVGTGDAQARRRTNLIVHGTPGGGASFSTIGAVTTRLQGKITVSSNGSASGIDAAPPNWTCPTPGGSIAGIAAPDTTNTNMAGTTSVPITGAPPVLETAAALDTLTYTKFGSITLDSIKAMANIIYTGKMKFGNEAPSVSGGVCNTADNKNFGEPAWSPAVVSPAIVPECHSYFPIIWAKDDLELQGGRGQGILIVDGDFAANGGTEFTGLVIVRGIFTFSGAGITIRGAMFNRNVGGANTQISGTSMVQYSSCAIAAATSKLGTGTLVSPAKQRAWSDFILTQ